jgi:DNA-binding transcriptional MerR regulator
MDYSKLTKLYYSIGEVAAMFDVNTSLLRFWETEFSNLKPKKNRRGTRQYRIEDIEIVERIFDLVKTQGYTIEGAKKNFANSNQQRFSSTQTNRIIQNLESVKSRLTQIKSQLQ